MPARARTKTLSGTADAVTMRRPSSCTAVQEPRSRRKRGPRRRRDPRRSAAACCSDAAWRRCCVCVCLLVEGQGRDVDHTSRPRAVAHQANPLRSAAHAHTLGVDQALLVPATAPAAVARAGRDETERRDELVAAAERTLVIGFLLTADLVLGCAAAENGLYASDPPRSSFVSPSFSSRWCFTSGLGALYRNAEEALH